MSNKNKVLSKVIVSIFILVIFIILCYLFKKYNFNDFEKSEYYINKTQFLRDSNEKYSKNNSYKLYSADFNDAAFYKKVKVEKNTVYKVTCMVKTENVQTEKGLSNAGAQISILDTVEKSKAIIGTSEWQKIELLFDSKDREEIRIGFRLGGYDDNCKGIACFSDFQIEKGVKDTSSEWKFGLFIFENLDVNIQKDGTIQNVKVSMNSEDIKTIAQDIERFKNSVQELSGNQMTSNTHIYDVKNPITTLSFDEENGYYIAPKDVESIINNVVSKNEFDHIFVAIKFGDIINNTQIPVNDWIGLGYMDYYGIGFSNIRLPNNSNSYIYRYDKNKNTFPEEVLLHEFLHSLERNLNERNYEIPELHSYSLYGYENNSLEGLKKWYSDYMQTNIKTSSGNIGLHSDVYTIKPVKQSCFENSTKLDYFDEPKNIFQEIGKLFSTLF